MTWVRIDDQWPGHPKVIEAGERAAWLWICGLCYCNRYLTDGFVPVSVLSRLVVGRDVHKRAVRLVEVGLWERAEGGYQIHDYHAYNLSAEEAKANREWDRRRKELYADPRLVAEIRARDHDRCRYCGRRVNWADRRGPLGGQYDHIRPRGPNTIDNLVVACRGCNIRKGSRTLEAAGMTLQPLEPDPNQNGTSSDLGQNQNGTSSELSPTWVRSNPSVSVSHPILEEQKQERVRVRSSPLAPGNGHGPPHGPSPDLDPVLTERAGRFVDRYAALYPVHRHGARYAVKPVRDFQAAVTLCQTWPDDDRLDKLAICFLTTDHDFAANGSRTIPQFLALASWCDGELSQWEHDHRRHVQSAH